MTEIRMIRCMCGVKLTDKLFCGMEVKQLIRNRKHSTSGTEK